MAIKATASAIVCTESFWTSKDCVGLTITPAELKLTISAGLEWNGEQCNQGIQGVITLGKVTFVSKIDIGLPGVGSLEFSYDIWDGYTWRFP